MARKIHDPLAPVMKSPAQICREKAHLESASAVRKAVTLRFKEQAAAKAKETARVETAARPAPKLKDLLALIEKAIHKHEGNAVAMRGNSNPQIRETYLRVIDRKTALEAVRDAMKGDLTQLRILAE